MESYIKNRSRALSIWKGNLWNKLKMFLIKSEIMKKLKMWKISLLNKYSWVKDKRGIENEKRENVLERL